ncbi:hypothetical protein EPA93_37285 [Ktedonosporobacter rubrisoli]|uniref:non-specific serine/threonine protein kinase n=1 Tax=Ktedonosporobacter rubrisoli TaxID=2509675 RepID=A0A4P6JZX2_KTERU|nr:ABC transporter substrate-binding protein [Ktedonosporobacter rubrisoli]QBD81329.1 hypothetical protein EPA93_37285 [Ktedonosporobacter rubrisoli]
MKCPFCGTDNPAGETFCTNCGGYLSASQPSSPPASSGGVSGPTSTGGGLGNSGSLAPNARLQQGRYVVDKVLGQGGMGAAVLARDTRVSNKSVVIKELISDSSDPQQHQEDVRNFEREVEMLASLDHPLVPTVTDSFQEGSRYFMVQECVVGENLEDHMERIKKPMPEQEALSYASQVLDILDYLSTQQPPIVHRDIKPANIIIGNKDKKAHLVDFGIARADVAKKAQKKQTSALGTPGYAPPEQYQGNADARSDLYALAATIHHLVTNRDPRDYPPFNYPRARSLNPQLSPDIERVLEHALKININERYQSAAEMKRDIDDILDSRYALRDTSHYMTGSSGPMVSPKPAPTPIPNPPTPVPNPPTPIPVSAGQQQIGTYARPKQQKSNNGYVVRSFILLLAVVIILGAVFFVLPRLRGNSQTGGQGSNNGPGFVTTPGATSTVVNGNGLGVTTIDGEPIGISDGTVAFDTKRADGDLKQQASAALKAGNSAQAQSLWRAALSKDTNDAEALIYLENQRVLASGSPYITLVVGTMVTGDSVVGVGRDTLQGAFVAQKEYNAGNGKLLGGVQVRLLIANSGSEAANSRKVAEQIVQAAQNDKTIVGVMGWPYSEQTVNAVNVLAGAKIPMISPTASADSLTDVSPYFFRVAPSDKSQAAVAVQYAKNKLHAKNVAVFEDQANTYSQSLAEDFKQQFIAAGGQVKVASYKVNDKQSVVSALQEALQASPAPDLIYFAGYSTDVSAILEQLPQEANFPDLQVLGGDALYNLAGYPQSARAGFARLHFTAFAYPDEWDVLGLGAKKPAFFTDYANAFDPNRAHQGSPYGYTRAAFNVVLAYDATLTLLSASKTALAGGTSGFTPTQLQQAIAGIKGTNAVQGVSGQISFDNDGDPSNKAVVMLYVNQGGFIQMEPQLGAGKFQAGS